MLKFYPSVGGTELPTNRAFFIVSLGNPGLDWTERRARPEAL